MPAFSAAWCWLSPARSLALVIFFSACFFVIMLAGRLIIKTLGYSLVRRIIQVIRFAVHLDIGNFNAFWQFNFVWLCHLFCSRVLVFNCLTDKSHYQYYRLGVNDSPTYYRK